MPASTVGVMSKPEQGAERPWMNETAQRRVAELQADHRQATSDGLRDRVDQLLEANEVTHALRCVNLNPATNVMSPRAEAALSAGLGSRPSLGHPGHKYETGLQAIEELEVMTYDLACRVFGARYAEFRVASGAMANLYAFMATCSAGDTIIVPPPSIGGHVTHNTAGTAGMYGLNIVEGPIDPAGHTTDVAGLRSLAAEVKPKLITVGTSLNLFAHPVSAMREVADEVGAALLFDAAHASGMIAGGQWPNPIEQGAHLMTMSTYKSLGGPAGGLIVSDNAEMAERVDAIAYPGLTANFDAGRSTALALTLLDWIDHGAQYGADMRSASMRLAEELARCGVDVYRPEPEGAFTDSHQFALTAAGGEGAGHAMALRLERANLLACAIGLPNGEGLRFGTPEAVRWGMGDEDMGPLAELITRALTDEPETVAGDVTAFRSAFRTVQYCS